MAEITIRPAQAADVGQLGAIGYAAWCKGIGVLIPPDAARLISEETFASFGQNSWEKILVAEMDSVIVGFVATGAVDNYVSDLWVSPEFEGQGAGSALIQAIEAQIQERQFDTVEIEVMTENKRALGLYLHLGYQITSQALKRDRYLLIELHKSRLVKTLRL